MTTLRFILLTQAFLSIFIAGGLFFKRDNLSNRSISIFVLVFGFEILVYLYSTSEVLLLYPQFASFFYFPIGFLYGPLLLLHVLSVKRIVIKWKLFALHFMPACLMIIMLLDIYAMDGASRVVYIEQNFINRIMPYNYARAIHIIGYGVWCVVIVWRNQFYEEYFNKLYSFIVCGIYFLSAVLVSFFTLFADSWRQFIFYYLLANSIVLVVGYLLHTKPNFLNALNKKYFSSSFSEEAMKRIRDRIHNEVVVSKGFLNRGLNLSKISETIGESTHSISQTLSVHVGKNFNDYLNFHRIEYAKGLLENSKFDYLKIEGIAIDSGFNNKVTFHKAFVKLTDTTPAIYRDEMRK